jgi:trimeric autotransporter adhesin
MAVFTILSATGYNMELLDVADLFAGVSEVRSATQYRVNDDATSYARFNGTGFAYINTFPDTEITGGTLTSMQLVEASATVFSLTGLSNNFTTVFNFNLAGDSQGFLSFLLFGDDTLNGGAANDTLMGFDGHDTLNGGSGSDVLFGGNGNDKLNGGVGSDVMEGGIGEDRYIVDNAGDVVIDAPGADVDTVESSINYVLGANIENLTLTGSATTGTGNNSFNLISGNALNNTLFGGGGNDEMGGLAGNDTLDGGLGGDEMVGGTGNDTYYIDDEGDFTVDIAGIDRVFSTITFSMQAGIENATLLVGAVNAEGNGLNNIITGNAINNEIGAGGGNDTVFGGDGGDRLDGAEGNDILHGEDGNDTLLGGLGTNTLNGGAGDDRLGGDTGTTTMRGGAGHDTYVIDDLDTVIENANEGIDTVRSLISYTLTANVERLQLEASGPAENATGNTLDNRLDGNNLSNVLDGAAGADIMTGLGGADTYIVDNIGDRAIEDPTINADIDTVQSSVTFRLGVNLDNLTLTGAGVIDGFGNILNNAITGNAKNNTLDGRGGNDTLSGGAGNDTLLGGTGNDSLSGGANNDVLNGGTGNDSLSGDAGNDVLDGGTGNDTMFGDLGNDVFFVDNGVDGINDTGGVDTVNSAVNYTLSLELENLTLIGNVATTGIGNAANNVIIGNALSNQLSGQGGNDIIEGGLGQDDMEGDAGADDFRYTHLAADKDNISDFEHLVDDIVFSVAAFEDAAAGVMFAPGALAANRLVVGPAGGTPAANLGAGIGQFLYDIDDGRLFWDQNGTTAGGQFHIATLSFVLGMIPAITTADFVVIA